MCGLYSPSLAGWRFGAGTYENVWKLNRELESRGEPLARQDVLLECTDVGTQAILVHLAGPALWRADESLRDRVLAKAVTFYDKLVPFPELTTEELSAKLGEEFRGNDDFRDLLGHV